MSEMMLYFPHLVSIFEIDEYMVIFLYCQIHCMIRFFLP